MRFWRVSLPLVCLIYHFIVIIITIANYVVFARFQDTPQDLRNAYLAFSVIEVIAYGFCAGPLFVYAYKYGKTTTARLGRLHSGIAIMFFFSSLPLLVIELVQLLILDEGFVYALDGIVFLLHGIAAAFGFLISWFAYMRLVARRLHQWRGPERQIADDAENGPGKDVQLRLVSRSASQPETI